MSRQTSLGAFGFTKIVTKKDGKAELFDISKVVCEEKLLTCKFCRERFGNAGALSTHIKCKHSVVISQPGEQSSSSGNLVVVNATNDEELEGPSMETYSSETLGKGNAGDKKNKYLHLKKKRLLYSVTFKAQVIHDREGGITSAELVEKYSSFRLDEPKICRWMKQKEAKMKAVFREHRNLFKIRPARMYINLYAELLKVFSASRGKSHRVDFSWLWLKARNLYRAQEGQYAVVKKHVVTNFIKRHHLKYRRVHLFL